MFIIITIKKLYFRIQHIDKTHNVAIIKVKQT